MLDISHVLYAEIKTFFIDRSQFIGNVGQVRYWEKRECSRQIEIRRMGILNLSATI